MPFEIVGLSNEVWLGRVESTFHSWSNFGGYLDDFVVIKDQALWISDFTPPGYYLLDSYCLIKTDDKHYWGYNSNAWSDLGIPSNSDDLKELFLTKGSLSYSFPNSEISLLGDKPVQLCYYNPNLDYIPTARLVAIPFVKFIKASGDISLASVEYINQISLVVNQLLNGKIKVVVSVDSGKTWKAFNGTAWNEVDVSTAQNVLDNGMEIAATSAITKSQWTQLAYSKSIRFGYAYSINSSEDTAVTNTLSMMVDMKGKWYNALESEHRYCYANNGLLQVELLATGDFKINY